MARIEYVGHATVFVDLDGVRLLTDPLLRNRVAHLRRSTPVSARTRRGVDAVLDLARALRPPRSAVAREARQDDPGRRPARPRRAAAQAAVRVGDRGRGRRDARDRRAADPCGSGGARREQEPDRRVGGSGRLRRVRLEVDLLRGRHRSLRRDARARAGGRRPHPDLGLGAGARWRGHLDPTRAAEAVARIEPGLVIPIHWGTYFPIHLGLTGKPGFVDLPPLEFLDGDEARRRPTSTSGCSGRARAWSSRREGDRPTRARRRPARGSRSRRARRRRRTVRTRRRGATPFAP